MLFTYKSQTDGYMANFYKTARLTISCLLVGALTQLSFAQTPQFYNNFGGTSTNSFPLNTTTSNKVQWIYGPNSLNSMGPTGNPAFSGVITKVYFRINTANASSVYSNFTISLGQPLGTATTFSPTTGTFPFVTGLQECFFSTSFSLTGAQSGAWYGIDLQNPFLYDPNLALVFEMKVSGGTGNSVGQVINSGQNQRIWGGFANPSGTTGTGLVDFGVDLTYLPVPNNAGVTALPSISNGFCADTIPVTATIVNFGNNVIDSVFVDWSVNNIGQAGQWFVLGLDTFGSGNNDTTLEIGSYLFQTGNIYDVKAWTSMPNNEPDTINVNDTTMVTVGPAMAGTYVIGSSVNADYATFTDAVADLNTLGVCDHVIFEVETGVYNEQFTINTILGADSNRTVTFRAQSLDSSDVTLTFSTFFPTTSVVTLNNADWVRFKHLTISNPSFSYDHAINLVGTSHDIEIENCHFIGNFNSTSLNAAIIVSTTGNNDNVTIRNNRFEGGGYAVYMYGTSTVSLERGLLIENNTMLNQYYHTVRLYYQDAPIIRGNYITSNAAYTSGAGLYLLYCDNAMEISSNHIVTDPNNPSAWPLYGIYMSLCDGSGFNNTGRTFNNRIVVGGDTNTTNASTYYGIFVTSTNAHRVANNTVTVLNGGGSARAFYQSASDLLFIQNNLFTTYSTGHAAYYLSGISIDIDRNNYYAPNGFEIYYGTTTFNVESFNVATGYDSNSYNVNPQWSNLFEGYMCNDMLDGIAEPLSYVPTDYSGFVRSQSNPDPGAVEFIGVNNFSLANDTICGNQLVLEVSGATNNLAWLVNGQPSSANAVTLENTGTSPQIFTVNVGFSSAIGCGATTSSGTYTLVPNVALDSNTHLCADATGSLSAGGGFNAGYTWFPTGETTETIQISNPGLYTVTKDELGCVSQSTTIVSKSIGVQLADIDVCNSDMPYTADATVPSGVSYVWDGGSSPNAAANTFTSAGTYNVTTTDAFGCTSSGSFNLEVIDVPVVNITSTHYGNLYLFSSATSQNVGNNASYFWNFGDGNTSTLANPQHLYVWSPVQETYTVSLSIANACGSENGSTIVYPDPLAVQEIASASFEVYPNPASDVVTISFSNIPQDGNLTITDVLGRVVMNEGLTNNSIQTLDVSALPSGNYIITVKTATTLEHTQLIID
jgi:hypothetical protein